MIAGHSVLELQLSKYTHTATDQNILKFSV